MNFNLPLLAAGNQLLLLLVEINYLTHRQVALGSQVLAKMPALVRDVGTPDVGDALVVALTGLPVEAPGHMEGMQWNEHILW